LIPLNKLENGKFFFLAEIPLDLLQIHFSIKMAVLGLVHFIVHILEENSETFDMIATGEINFALEGQQ
jgi:hypothetical protein